MKPAVATVFVAILALAGTAAAQNVPTIGVERHSDRVVITVTGVSATGTAIPGDGYIDIPLAAGARAAAYARIDDPTVRKVEVGDAKEPIVRVKLRTGQRQTLAIAGAVALVQVANGTQITIVRNPAAPARAPEPAKAAPAAASSGPAAAAVAPIIVPVAVPVPTPAAAPAAEAKAPVEATPDLTEPAPAAEPAPPAATAPAVTAGPQVTGIPAETARPLELAPTTGSGLPWTSIIVLIGVAAAGVLVVRKTRGQRTGADAPQMTMRATMSLGAKAKVVLLTADDRELLVAVDSKGVRLLDSWNRGEAPEAAARSNDADGAELEADEAAVAPDFASLVARVGGSRAPTRAGTQTGAIPRLATEGAVSQRMSTQSGLSQRFKAPTEPPPRAQPRLVTRNDELDDDLDDGRAPRARTSSDQISGLLRLRHAARAEDAASSEPTEGESPWAQHLMASLRRGKPS